MQWDRVHNVTEGLMVSDDDGVDDPNDSNTLRRLSKAPSTHKTTSYCKPTVSRYHFLANLDYPTPGGILVSMLPSIRGAPTWTSKTSNVPQGADIGLSRG